MNVPFISQPPYAHHDAARGKQFQHWSTHSMVHTRFQNHTSSSSSSTFNRCFPFSVSLPHRIARRHPHPMILHFLSRARFWVYYYEYNLIEDSTSAFRINIKNANTDDHNHAFKFTDNAYLGEGFSDLENDKFFYARSRTQPSSRSKHSENEATKLRNRPTYKSLPQKEITIDGQNFDTRKRQIELTKFIKRLGKQGKCETAVQLVKTSSIANVYMWSAAIMACGFCGKWKMAVSLLEEMKNSTLSGNGYITKGIQPDGFCYSAAIRACAEAGKWRIAIQLLDEMKQVARRRKRKGLSYVEIEPDLVVYGSCVAACEKRKVLSTCSSISG